MRRDADGTQKLGEFGDEETAVLEETRKARLSTIESVMSALRWRGSASRTRD
jgi:hypothetical protein